jgi:hypothetical protein
MGLSTDHELAEVDDHLTEGGVDVAGANVAGTRRA